MNCKVWRYKDRNSDFITDDFPFLFCFEAWGGHSYIENSTGKKIHKIQITSISCNHFSCVCCCFELPQQGTEEYPGEAMGRPVTRALPRGRVSAPEKPRPASRRATQWRPGLQLNNSSPTEPDQKTDFNFTRTQQLKKNKYKLWLKGESESQPRRAWGCRARHPRNPTLCLLGPRLSSLCRTLCRAACSTLPTRLPVCRTEKGREGESTGCEARP